MSKKTLVIGASTEPSRYSNMAINRLVTYGHEVVALGKTGGSVKGVPIEKQARPYKDLDTVTMYINPTVQQQYYDYIVSLKPRRVIFNPGTENDELYNLLDKNGIRHQEACTLVMLGTGQY